MRKQYHFQQADRGLLAWNVHGLVDATRALRPRPLLLSSIDEIDEPYWFDPLGPAPSCRDLIDHMRLVEATSLDYPIILSAEGRVMDGMHRVAKAVLQGRSHIMAVRFARTPEPDYVGVNPDALPYDT